MSAPVPLRRVHLVAAELSVAVSVLLVLAVLSTSTNSAGYRLKGTLLLAAGAVLFLLSVARIRGWTAARDPRHARILLGGLIYFAVFAAAAVLTLTLDFRDPVERATGIGTQLIAAAVGIYGCIRYLRAV